MFFHLKSSQITSRMIDFPNLIHKGSGHWIRLMRKEFVKCETITVAIYSDKSVLMHDNSSRWLCFALQFLLVVYSFTASVLTRCTFLPHRAVLACLLHATLMFLLNKVRKIMKPASTEISTLVRSLYKLSDLLIKEQSENLQVSMMKASAFSYHMLNNFVTVNTSCPW